MVPQRLQHIQVNVSDFCTTREVALSDLPLCTPPSQSCLIFVLIVHSPRLIWSVCLQVLHAMATRATGYAERHASYSVCTLKVRL